MDYTLHRDLTQEHIHQPKYHASTHEIGGVDPITGTIGISGYSGFSGDSISGYSGYSGLGVSGYSGYSGSGVSGYSGYSGYNGESGYSGISGYSGFSGYSGLQAVGQIWYLTNTNSTISTYKVLDKTPNMGNTVAFTADVKESQGEVLLVECITDPMQRTSLAAGIRTFSVYASVDDPDAGLSKICAHVYKRSLLGVETFVYEVLTPVITSTEQFQYTGIISIPTGILLPTDRMLVRYYALTTSNKTVTVSLYCQDNTQTAIQTPVPVYGESGHSGYSGTSGYSGSGLSGYSGESGYSGSGISGYSGYSGSGVSGYSGYSGESGYSGISSIVEVVDCYDDLDPLAPSGTLAIVKYDTTAQKATPNLSPYTYYDVLYVNPIPPAISSLGLTEDAAYVLSLASGVYIGEFNIFPIDGSIQLINSIIAGQNVIQTQWYYFEEITEFNIDYEYFRFAPGYNKIIAKLLFDEAFENYTVYEVTSQLPNMAPKLANAGIFSDVPVSILNSLFDVDPYEIRYSGIYESIGPSGWRILTDNAIWNPLPGC